jgi:hypothetical protein
LPAEARPVGAAEVLDVPAPAAEGERDVSTGGEGIVQNDGVVDVAADGVGRSQRECGAEG